MQYMLLIHDDPTAWSGMSEEQVRQGIHKDFLAVKISNAIHPSEKTTVLSLTTADLLPNTGNARWLMSGLSNSYERLGDVLRDQGNLVAALNTHHDSLSIRQKLANQDPGNAGWQRDLSISHYKIGDVQKALIELADRNVDVILPGFPHLQVAQPVSFGHHMLAYVEMFSRDAERMADVRKRVKSEMKASSIQRTWPVSVSVRNEQPLALTSICRTVNLSPKKVRW